MATNFPGGIDTFPPASPTSGLDNPSHSGLHNDLGDGLTAVQTQLVNQPYGLVHIEQQAFSAVSFFSFSNDVFLTDYDNYRILMYFSASTASQINWRGRIAGADTTAANYNNQIFQAAGTNTGIARQTAQTSARLGPAQDATAQNAISIDIFAPKLSLPTRTISQTFGSADGAFIEIGGSAYTLTTNFDSITILILSGNMTGKAFLYGYRN